MKYHPLGQSGLYVSEYVLGSLTFAGTNGFEALGSVDAAQARRMVEAALDAGVNAVDTANLYSKGDAESVVGRAIADRRDDLLLFSKAASPMTDGPNGAGASRAHLSRQIDDSLRRLGTDHLDLYFVHRWDGVTPVEETVQTMGGLVKSGKIRYWGISNYSGWQVAKTVMLARQMHLPPPVAHQVYYTPAAREAEYEIIPAGEELGVATVVWSPLGQGLLTGRVDRNTPPPADTRQGDDHWPEPYVADRDTLWNVIDALKRIAAARDVSVAQVTLAWLRGQPPVRSIVLGARNEAQLGDNLDSARLELSSGELEIIERAGRPPAIYPYWHRAMWALDRPTPAEREYLQRHRLSMGLKRTDEQ
ncbi:aldo/keto reductase [Luteibacter sp. CQ10]|uniref:aldo/keto reductase n=1 Tax=Luteibacter sp. CQ10 TaxID=2805821 RepID=UPI0034A1A6F2